MYNTCNPFNLLYFSWDIFTYVTAGICNKWLSWLHSLSSVATYWIYKDTTVTTHFRSFISIESARLVCDTSSCSRRGAVRCDDGLWVYDPLKTNLNKPGLFYETGPWMMKQKQTAKQLKQKKTEPKRSHQDDERQNEQRELKNNNKNRFEQKHRAKNLMRMMKQRELSKAKQKQTTNWTNPKTEEKKYWGFWSKQNKTTQRIKLH